MKQRAYICFYFRISKRKRGYYQNGLLDDRIRCPVEPTTVKGSKILEMLTSAVTANGLEIKLAKLTVIGI